MDLFAKCYRFTRAHDARSSGGYPYFLPFSETDGPEVVYRGRRIVMAGSNNYLGLTTDPEVQAAAAAALARYGTSCTGSRFLNGTLELHQTLESELAQFLGKPAALVFTTGFQANLGAISALAGRGDVVLIDRDDHASIVEGCRLSGATVRRFRHNDLDHLERLLRGCPPTAGRMVVVDGVYSMGGDLAPLPALVRLCQHYGARLLVDDAHATGVLADGRGTPAHFGLTAQVDLISGTFSKAFASVGGFVAGDQAVIDYIRHHARSFIFSASLPPASVAAALAALRIIRREPQRARRVQQIGARMRATLRQQGYDTAASASPIVPVVLGSEADALAHWQQLFAAGIYVNVVVPPAVPAGSALLRTSYMATHTDAHLTQIADAFAELAAARPAMQAVV